MYTDSDKNSRTDLPVHLRLLKNSSRWRCQLTVIDLIHTIICLGQSIQNISFTLNNAVSMIIRNEFSQRRQTVDKFNLTMEPNCDVNNTNA